MKVALMTWGSRGDVQPFIALATTLLARGHTPLIFGPSTELQQANIRGLPTAPIDDHLADLRPALRPRGTDLVGLQRAIRMGCNMKQIRTILSRFLREFTESIPDDTDVIVHHYSFPFHQIAEKLNISHFPVVFSPGHFPIDDIPNPRFPIRVPVTLNRATYLWPNFQQLGISYAFSKPVHEWRRNVLGLTPRRRHHLDSRSGPNGTPATLLQAFSKSLMPPGSREPSSAVTTGYWFLPDNPDWVPSAELSQFVNGEGPVIYVGFGSIVGTDPSTMRGVISDALRKADVRAVITRGSGGISASCSDDNILYLEDAPFDWLYPRMSALVHHGGSGTVGTGLAAGVPQVVCPPASPILKLNAMLAYQRGVAPPPIPHQSLTSDRLAQAIMQVVDDNDKGRRAALIRGAIMAENGNARAVDIIEQVSG